MIVHIEEPMKSTEKYTIRTGQWAQQSYRTQDQHTKPNCFLFTSNTKLKIEIKISIYTSIKMQKDYLNKLRDIPCSWVGRQTHL